MFTTNQIKEEYWESLSIDVKDIEFIYNYLLEKEIPLSTETLLISLINQRILREKMNAEKQKSKSISVYLPKNEYEIGDVLSFPAFEMQSGTVVKIREGLNPEYDNLKVIEVKFDSGEVKEFAGNIDAHPLNLVLDISKDDPNYDPQAVLSAYGKEILSVLDLALNKNEDLVNIAGNWFPRSLLVDVHIGHLNLAEAALEEVNGGPLGTDVLMEQVEFNANADKKLLEFSFDLALQEDERFDEVGPAGKTFWFLYALEPDPVKNTPQFLKYSDDIPDAEPLSEYMSLFESNIYDELEKWDSNIDNNNRAVISLSYPHWRSGTLPLSNTLKNMFPTAYEAPRVKFSFVDCANNEKFPGWVVREKKYVFGLKNWYEKCNLIPGSLVVIENSEIPGEINIQFNKSRQNKEWIKTVLIGVDKAIVFAMLKQSISADYNERMALAITDTDALDEIWDKRIYQKEPIGKTIIRIMRELGKLNPQGQVHAQELYAAVNVVRRCPPSMVVSQLLKEPAVEYLGDLYFRFTNKENE